MFRIANGRFQSHQNNTQTVFPLDNPYFTIAQLIQDLCLLYYGIVIDSKILTNEEQMKLLEMVSKHINIESAWILYYTEHQPMASKLKTKQM